jgi:hypothetical protein
MESSIHPSHRISENAAGASAGDPKANLGGLPSLLKTNKESDNLRERHLWGNNVKYGGKNDARLGKTLINLPERPADVFGREYETSLMHKFGFCLDWLVECDFSKKSWG